MSENTPFRKLHFYTTIARICNFLAHSFYKNLLYMKNDFMYFRKYPEMIPEPPAFFSDVFVIFF